MPISESDNEYLVRVGKGTPAGQMHRRYWLLAAAASQIPVGGTRLIQLLGESLVLFRSIDGKLGVVNERCPHRGASMSYGIVDPNGLRCPYHGWLFGYDGKCLHRPSERQPDVAACSILIQSYSVTEVDGLVFVYLGDPPVPPAPSMPKFKEDSHTRTLRFAEIPCNWLQIMENSLDPIHLEWLHGHTANFFDEQAGGTDQLDVTQHSEIQFDQLDYGIVKRRVVPGQDKNHEDWRIGQTVFFPYTFCIRSPRWLELQVRIPATDTSTLHFWYRIGENSNSHKSNEELQVSMAKIFRENGDFDMATVDGQDVMAWVTQGAIADRTTENLGQEDRGIVMLRKLLQSQIRAVENGRAPINTVAADIPSWDVIAPVRTEAVPILTSRRINQ